MYRSNLAHRGTSLIQQSKKMCLFLLVLHENKVNVGERVETTGNVFAEIPLDYHLTSHHVCAAQSNLVLKPEHGWNPNWDQQRPV